MKRHARVTGPVLGAVCLLALAAGCGEEEPESTPGEAPSETTSAAQECPDVLPEQQSGEQFGADPAQEPPDLPEAQSAWVCSYVQKNGGDVSAWALDGDAVPVPDDRLADLEASFGELRPAPERPLCTEDLGPRYLVVMDTGDGLTSVAVDDFGCRFVRVLGDPASEGADATPGVLTGPNALVPTLRKLAG